MTQWTRAFSQSQTRRADDFSNQLGGSSLSPPPSAFATSTTAAPLPSTPTPKPAAVNRMAFLAQSFMGKAVNARPMPAAELSDKIGFTDETEAASGEPWHFHIYSHKHNTHVTVTKPNRDAVIAMSCGNLGFKKSGRKHYDAAYQLGAYVLDRLYQDGYAKKIGKVEVQLRGFGAGREAVVKVLLGNEGKWLRDKIKKVSDSTRLKFGGTRSKKPRRLG
jgi:small subunit ribosomal protein S11